MIPRVWVRLSGGWWQHRERCLRSRGGFVRRIQVGVYKMYVEEHGGYVSLLAEFAGEPRLPHKMLSVFIAPPGARIGSGVTIHQQVTIGKNDDPDSPPRFGSPTIGDGVYIGAGAR